MNHRLINLFFSFNKIYPDRQLTYPKFAKLVRIPTYADWKFLANPVRIEPSCWSKNLKFCPNSDISSWLIFRDPIEISLYTSGP